MSDQQNEEDEASVHATEDSEDASGEYVLCMYVCGAVSARVCGR